MPTEGDRAESAALDQAREHLRAGRWGEVEAICRSLLAREPELPAAVFLMGRAAYGAGDRRAAAQLFSRAAVLVPHNAEYHAASAATWSALGEIDLAIESYRRVAELESASAEAHFHLGNALQERARVNEAVASYQKAIGLRPDYANAHCNLGVAYRLLGRLDDAVTSYQRAIACNPSLAEAHQNLGNLMLLQEHLDEAVDASRRAIELKPDYAEAYANLGSAIARQGRSGEAVSCFTKAIALKPRLPELQYNLAQALTMLGLVDQAIERYRAALALRPNYPEAHSGLGFALDRRGRLDEALTHCTRSIELKPDSADAHRNLGLVLRDSGRLPEAAACLRKAVDLRPDFAEAYHDLSTVLQAQGDLDAALAACDQAISANPRFAWAHCGRGVALAELGRVEEAINAVERAIELNPGYEEAHSALLFLLNYSEHYDGHAIFERHRQWAKPRETEIASQILPHLNDRRTTRRLRLGYVSADFRQHSVAFFIAPILAHHDREEFEIVCYSDVRRPDAVTRQLHGYVDGWRSIAGLRDEQVAQLIREDRIDILIDLAVHSGSNRLLVLARKPAPVQATHIGYAGTTGLMSVDYRITDAWMDPPGKTEAYYTESLLRLPRCSSCYQAPPDYPEVGPAPCLTRGGITFAAFQNLMKVSNRAVELWARILVSIPGSRLIIKAGGLASAATRARLKGMFAAHGVGNERIRMENWGSLPEYLERLSEVDIALDTTPFNGGTSTCHTLWMGVPVVTLAGQTSVGRVGASVLMNLGLRELVAETPGQYVELACRLAADRAWLSELRASLREKMMRSALMDGRGFTEDLEAAYRAAWVKWCNNI